MSNLIREHKAAILPILIGLGMFARGMNLYLHPESNPSGWTTASGISVEGVGMLILAFVLVGFGLYKIFR
ncbi:MAG: hypothetical protein AAF433_08750 [Bacteroidota bacterium]